MYEGLLVFCLRTARSYFFSNIIDVCASPFAEFGENSIIRKRIIYQAWAGWNCAWKMPLFIK
jgi:hypothetical protein